MLEQISFFDADNAETVLSEGPDSLIMPGLEGRFMPDFSFIEKEVPLQPGTRLDQVKTLPKEVVVPHFIAAANDVALRVKLRALARALNPDRGFGRLRVTDPMGGQREVTCRYASGLDLPETKDAAGTYWKKSLLVFRCFDPYWYDTAGIVETFETGAVAGWFPMFPLRLSSSEIFADVSVDNEGDIEAWPVWIINGPATNPVLRNITTGKLLQLTLTLLAGETLTIDTRPGAKSITKNDGSNQFGKQVAGSSLWVLRTGPNAIRVEMAGSSQDSSVQLTYKRRWLVS